MQSLDDKKQYIDFILCYLRDIFHLFKESDGTKSKT